MAPPTNPFRKNPAGTQVVRADPATGQIVPFVSNPGDGPASAQNAVGQGLDRPFDVQFGPDGAMYIVDYGVATIDKSKKPPYVYKESSGAVWMVIKEK